jgi:hypothetical protein
MTPGGTRSWSALCSRGWTPSAHLNLALVAGAQGGLTLSPDVGELDVDF